MLACGFYYEFYDHHTLSHHYHRIITHYHIIVTTCSLVVLLFREAASCLAVARGDDHHTLSHRIRVNRPGSDQGSDHPLLKTGGEFPYFWAQSSDGIVNGKNGRSMTIRF